MSNPVYVSCNSVDISSSVDWPSLDLTMVLTKEVSSLTFKVRFSPGQTTPAKTVPKVNDIIRMYDSSGQIFGGQVTETAATIEGLMLTYDITCVDWSYLLDGTLVAKNYSMMDPHDIVLDIIANFAAGKGFTTNHVQTGNFLVPSIKFNYEQPTKCLEKLAKTIGWEWYVDPAKDIHFFLAETATAPITVDETSGQIEWNSLNLTENLQNMKNSVFVIGSTYTKTFNATTTKDVYQTDGIRQVFSLAYAYKKATMVVTLDGVAQTVGTDQQTDPSTVQVLYNDQGRFISFTAGPPATGKTVKIYGDAEIPILAHATDPAAIATYGEFQDSIVDKQITSVAEAHERAKAEILQFGSANYDLTFKTLVAGCRIGQTLTMNSPKFGITNQSFVIKRIEAKVFAPGENAQLEYQIQALSADNVTFVDIMAVLLQQENSNTSIEDSTVLQVLVPVSENMTINDTPAVSGASEPYFWGPWPTNEIRWGFFTWD